MARSGGIVMNKCLKAAQEKLNIQAVNLKESKIHIRDDIDLISLNKDETFTQSFRLVEKIKQYRLESFDKNEMWDYRFIYSAGIRIVYKEEKEESSDDDYEPILEIVGVFEAKYLSDCKLDEEELKAYSADNVGYHVWPYWREYVQSTCSRVGYSSSIEVPVYMISNRDS